MLGNRAIHVYHKVANMAKYRETAARQHQICVTTMVEEEAERQAWPSRDDVSQAAALVSISPDVICLSTTFNGGESIRTFADTCLLKVVSLGAAAEKEKADW